MKTARREISCRPHRSEHHITTYKARSTGNPTIAEATPTTNGSGAVAKTSPTRSAHRPAQASNARGHTRLYPHAHATRPTVPRNGGTAPRSCVSVGRRTPNCASRTTGIRAPRRSLPSRPPTRCHRGLAMQVRASSRVESSCRCWVSTPGWTTLPPGGERAIAIETLGDRRWYRRVFGVFSSRGMKGASFDRCSVSAVFFDWRARDGRSLRRGG